MTFDDQIGSKFEPRTMMVLNVLLRLKAAPEDLIGKRQNQASLIVMYSFIDICASLSNRKKDAKPGEVFRAYVEGFMEEPFTPPFTSEELWAARSSVLHCMSPLGHLTAKHQIRPIFYYSWPEKEEEALAVIGPQWRGKGLLLSIHDLHAYSLQAFNNFYSKIEEDQEFEKLVAENGTEVVADVSDQRFYSALNVIEKIEM